MMALLIIMRGMVLLEALFTKWPSTVRRLYFTEECGPQLFGRITWPDAVVFAAFAVHTLHSPKFERIALHATALFPQVQICEVCLQKRQTVVRIPPDWNANGAVYQTNKKVSNSGRALRLKFFVWSSSSAVLLGLSVWGFLSLRDALQQHSLIVQPLRYSGKDVNGVIVLSNWTTLVSHRSF